MARCFPIPGLAIFRISCLPANGQIKDDLFTGWMLLSYKKPCTASSVRDTFAAPNVTDENPRTFWVANTRNKGEWITVDLLKTCDVRAVQVNFTDYKSGIFDSDSTVYTQFRLYHSADGQTLGIAG